MELRALFAPPVAGQTSPIGGRLEMTNIGSMACRVQGRLNWWVGPKPADIARASALDIEVPAVLLPGRTAAAALSWWGQECSGSAALNRIGVEFVGQDGFADADVVATGLQRGPCNYPDSDSGFGTWLGVLSRMHFNYPRDVLTQLVLAVISPARADMNVAFPVTLVLTNVTNRPAVFDHKRPPGGTVRCPVVSFSIGDLESQERMLDCTPGRSIPPRGSARYQLAMTTDLSFECITLLHMRYAELPGAGTSAPLTVQNCGMPPSKEPVSSR